MKSLNFLMSYVGKTMYWLPANSLILTACQLADILQIDFIPIQLDRFQQIKVEKVNNEIMLNQKRKLVLFEAKEIKFTGEQGEITKTKYSFLTPNNELIIGYGDKGLLKKHVKDVEEYSEDNAMIYSFKGRAWDNELKWSLDETVEPKRPA